MRNRAFCLIGAVAVCLPCELRDEWHAEFIGVYGAGCCDCSSELFMLLELLMFGLLYFLSSIVCGMIISKVAFLCYFMPRGFDNLVRSFGMV